MNCQLRNDAEKIIKQAILAVQPDAAVKRALENKKSLVGFFLSLLEKRPGL